MSQTQVIDILSVFGPIHTFYEVAEGEFIVRYCYDLCTEFVHKHLVEQAESGSPLVKTQKIPENLQMERIDTLEEWVWETSIFGKKDIWQELHGFKSHKPF